MYNDASSFKNEFHFFVVVVVNISHFLGLGTEMKGVEVDSSDIGGHVLRPGINLTIGPNLSTGPRL